MKYLHRDVSKYVYKDMVTDAPQLARCAVHWSVSVWADQAGVVTS